MQNHVYALLNPGRPGKYQYGEYSFDYEPYYIGMSYRENRRFGHIFYAFYPDNNCEPSLKELKIRQLIRRFGIEKVLKFAIKIKDNLTREEASLIEYKLVNDIGRVCLKTGPLTNVSNGGGNNFTKYYSDTPEESRELNSSSMKRWFSQNRNKTFSDLPVMKSRVIHCNDHGVHGGSRNGNSNYYYLLITPDGAYHLFSKGCLKMCIELFDINPTTFEDSAKKNERRTDNNFARIMRGKAIGWYAFRFKSLEECPVNITMDNQQPS